jgi:hypothetical protein
MSRPVSAHPTRFGKLACCCSGFGESGDNAIDEGIDHCVFGSLGAIGPGTLGISTGAFLSYRVRQSNDDYAESALPDQPGREWIEPRVTAGGCSRSRDRSRRQHA